MASRTRFVLAQLVTTPAARDGLARLLDGPDLEDAAADPQQWRRLDQRTWRTGAVADAQPWQVAARAAGSVTAWRSLAAGRHRWLWLQWSPMATPADARAALAAADDPALELNNPRARVEREGRQALEPAPQVAGADRVTAIEEHTTGPDPVRTLRVTAGRHVVLLCASGQGWSWPALVALAELQLPRLPTT